ncbi:MADS-box protein soc1-like [Orobanche gracilis]
MHGTIERYRKHAKEIEANNPPAEVDTQHLKHEAESMMKKIEQLETSKRKLLGEGLGTCTIEELQQLERQLERSVNIIRARKNVHPNTLCSCGQEGDLQYRDKYTYGINLQLLRTQSEMHVYKQQIEHLKEKGRALAAENAMLCEKFGVETQRKRSNKDKTIGTSTEISEVSDVETDLFIGLPETRNKRPLPEMALL